MPYGHMSHVMTSNTVTVLEQAQACYAYGCLSSALQHAA